MSVTVLGSAFVVFYIISLITLCSPVRCVCPPFYVKSSLKTPAPKSHLGNSRALVQTQVCLPGACSNLLGFSSFMGTEVLGWRWVGGRKGRTKPRAR